MKISRTEGLPAGRREVFGLGNPVPLDVDFPQEIARRMGMQEGLCFSRGSAGLYALLTALAKRFGPGEVIVPTLCCETVALAAHYAGHSPRFADVSPDTLCLTPTSARPLMSARTRAVLVAHLFGIDACVGAFDNLRRMFPDCVFIEDAAHALGGFDRAGRLLGGGLDCTLLSFAESKIISGEGGMILFGNSPSVPAPRDLARELFLDAERRDHPRLALSLRNLSHSSAELWRKNTNWRPEIFRRAMSSYRSLIVSPGGLGDPRIVTSGLQQLGNNRFFRYRNYARYRDEIDTPHALVTSLHEGSTCWRCPVVCDTPERAIATTKRLREAGIHASNHYFPLSVLFDGEPCPVGEDIARRIVNLWTANSTPAIMVRDSINIINKY